MRLVPGSDPPRPAVSGSLDRDQVGGQENLSDYTVSSPEIIIIANSDMTLSH